MGEEHVFPVHEEARQQQSNPIQWLRHFLSLLQLQLFIVVLFKDKFVVQIRGNYMCSLKHLKLHVEVI